MTPSLFKRTSMLPSFLSASLLFAGTALSSPFLQSRATNLSPAININFPDPAVMQDTDGTWYAFATNGNGKNVQSASAPSINGPWTVLNNDLLPTVGAWSNGANVWAPDVRMIGSSYVLYYAATDAASTNQHCVGTATSDTILGPYTPRSSTIACDVAAGGAIDPSGFTDADGNHYVVYKIDGNSVGHGGSCGNTVDPIVPTPLMLQQLEADGVTPSGDPIELLDRGDADGPLIEAPNLILVNGVYFLFFSSNCYSTTLYDISYATASSVKGPFTKSSAPLAVTGNPFNLTAPGGATATTNGKNMVFHANCDAGRCMYESAITVSGTAVSFS
ncbi:related to endo-arabinase [Phialocephala subalpina]|uniref:Related to endo-arabinase n=1 Tax=Phialocephala subalpina TaxID=576137 RepID=A0A1L7X2I8_9HELO|nr:related to endo-arabinase [Phialocephala subalpina]